jgi:hypothetical protein
MAGNVQTVVATQYAYNVYAPAFAMMDALSVEIPRNVNMPFLQKILMYIL